MKEKKHEFSKLILIVAAILNFSVMIFTCVMVWRTNDLTPLAYLIPSTAAEVATGTAFYYNKAKAENRLKLMKIYGIDINENNFDGKGEYGYGGPYGNNLGTTYTDGSSDYIVSDSANQT